MDVLTEQLATFAAELRPDALPTSALDSAALAVFDSVGCALGARRSAAVAIARRLCPQVSGGARGRVMSFPEEFSSLDAAGFANGVMIRELDYNDWYPGGHPSDCLGPILAAAEYAGADGAAVLTATVVAYEIFARICEAAPLKQRGWDQGFGVSVATAAAVGNLLHLDRDAIGEAISIAAVAHLPLRATKAGRLSMWKSAAAPHAARNGMLSALLAKEGMTGPESVFAGRDGVWELVSGEFAVLPFGGKPADYLTSQVSLKYWPVCYGLQAPVTGAIELRQRVPLDEVASINVQTYQAAWKLNGSDEEKWDPRNRETADHSIPYAIVWTMLHGHMDPSSLRPESFTDESLRPLMKLVTVEVGADAEAAYPDDVLTRLVATKRNGEIVEVLTTNPPGHIKNPLTAAQSDEKFNRLAAAELGRDRACEVAEFWRDIRTADGLTEGFALMLP